MADVYLARRRAAGVEKWLVVKRMRPERTGDPRFLDLFVREARLSMSLAHQNIVPVFDFGRIDEQVFLAMERVEGKDLGSSLARAPSHRLPPLLAAFIAAECCQALDYAHQRKGPDGVALGIVHRDVTPRNVLLSWSGEVKLTDFGIAALAGDATSRLLGTPQYMAPEQARSEPIDPRADLYAIGLVLREAVTGIRPRPGTDRDSILDAARRGELLPWSHAAAAAPPDTGLALGSGDHGEPPAAAEVPPAAAEELSATLVAIIDRATAVAAADRYADARTMLEDLDAFIVAQRAAHKAESPARQLAAWLAAVWEGERDDADADAAIEADHLVSFLDDGAFDVIGTGTVRSLAATAADEVPDDDAAELASPPPPPPPTAKATVVATPGGKPAAAPAGETGADRAARLSRISSSISTVASGSFHTIPTPGGTGRVPRSGPRKPRRGAQVAGIALISIASGAVVFWAMSGLRSRAPERPGQLAAGQPSSGQPSSGQPSSGQPNPGQPNPGQPNPGQSNPGQSGSGQPNSGQLGSGQPGSGLRRTGQPGTGQPSSARPSSGQSGITPTGPGTTSAGHGASPPPHPAPGSGSQAPRTGRPTSEPPGQDPGPSSGSAGGSGSASGVGSDPPRPATCKVRFNMTPWAYYTVDEDSTRHETPGTIELTPGPHRLHVWNPELHVERDITIEVPADRDVMSYSEPLQPSSLPPASR